MASRYLSMPREQLGYAEGYKFRTNHKILAQPE
jgi:hypothetical protein